MIFDVHTHFDSRNPDELKIFVAECAALGTRVGICSGGPHCDHEYPENEFIAQAVRPYADILIPFAFVDLWNTVDTRCVERFREQGFRGLKCITPYYPYDHDLYMPIYEAAERLGMPVLFHTGLYRPNPKARIHRRPLVANMRPLGLDRIARTFQNLKIIMAHMGTALFRHEAAQLALLHPNLYVDLAGMGNWMAMQPAELAVLLGSCVCEVDASFGGFKKLVLGSDAYVTVPSLLRKAQAWYSRTLQRVGVPDEIVSGIMGGTVEAWLKAQTGRVTG